MVLVDAMRPDYVAHAPFIRGLSASAATGSFREGFGFVPRQAYFGGLATAEFGFTNMFSFDPENSPFGAAWQFSGRRFETIRDEPAGARKMIEDVARERLTPFARSYMSTHQIPLGWLPFFDLVEKRAPWERKAGYRSLFAILDEQGIPWKQSMWPDTTALADPGDKGIVRHIASILGPADRLGCVHLQQLDSVGHIHGPGSRELIAAIRETDSLLRGLVEDLRGRYDRLGIVLFGDHGMVNVTGALDIAAALKRTGLAFGADYVCFLDSSMARFWFFHEGARRKIVETLAAVPGGHVLSDEELRHHGLAGCDRRNGELYFLADPGVLILPNFFQDSGRPIPGMHGYDPDCPDNLGYFLLHDSARPELAGSTMGKVDPHQLFPILLESLGLDPAAHTKHAAPRPARVPGGRRRFTQHPDAAAEELVRAHVERIVKAVGERAGEVEAIVLTGSFGRGEGGVHRDASGRLRPANDYDIVVVDPRDCRGALEGLGGELARELGTDFVDFCWMDGRFGKLPHTIFTHDLKYGSRVVAGDRTVLDRIPEFAAADIPVFEFVRQLLNRAAGVLSGWRGEFLNGAKPEGDERRYLANQFSKLLIALGDWHLFRWQGFDSSYTIRRRRFESLARGAGIDSATAERIIRAYDFKLRPDYAEPGDERDLLREIFPEIECALIDSVGMLTGRRAATLVEAMTGYLSHMSADTAATARDNQACRAIAGMAGIRCESAPAASIRHGIQSSLPHLLGAAAGDRPAENLSHARRHLEPGLVVPACAAFSPDAWEAHRELAIKAWFAACH